jgi:cell division protein ZapA (FtsZ GTPase activity inhibitor)
MRTMLTIDTVYDLLQLQGEIIQDLEKRSWSQDFKKEMKQKIRQLSRLLDAVNKKGRGYLGGDEVLITVKEIREDVKKRIDNI